MRLIFEAALKRPNLSECSLPNENITARRAVAPLHTICDSGNSVMRGSLRLDQVANPRMHGLASTIPNLNIPYTRFMLAFAGMRPVLDSAVDSDNAPPILRP